MGLNDSLINEYESYLREVVEALDCSAETKAVVAYTMFPGGKRIRPMMMLSVAVDLGVEPRLIMPHAAAIELLHVASLIHDDLPAVDDDDYRRGRESAHVVFGEGRALLAADYIIAAAIGLSCSSSPPHIVPRNVGAELAICFSKVSDGQVLDLIGEKASVGLSEVHYRKTGAMFETAFTVPALIRGVDSEVEEGFRQLGREFGRLFQMVDDFIDVYGTDQERGRAGSSDLRNGKITSVTGRPIEEARSSVEGAERAVMSILQSIEGAIRSAEFEMTREVVNRHRARVAAIVERSWNT